MSAASRGLVAAWRGGAAGEHGWEDWGQRDVMDLGDRAQAGEDGRRVRRVEQAVSADDDGVPAVLEQRDGQLCGRASTIALRASSGSSQRASTLR